MDSFQIHDDIRQAKTLPGSFYGDGDSFHEMRNSIFSRHWLVLDIDPGQGDQMNLHPVDLLPAFLDEPLLLVQDGEEEYCLSNVCTHRGNILVDEPCNQQSIRCGYHGKCFDLSGQYKSMPGFEAALSFPSAKDHLPRLPLHRLGAIRFTSLDPAVPFDGVIAPILEYMPWYDFSALSYHSRLSRTYQLQAHWALYCENYLEGFHIPFVHENLNKALEFSTYRTELFPYCSLQVGVAKEGQPYFDLPPEHPDYGQKILAYYWWIFPNTMLNIYTWGISLNIVRPISIDSTEIVFKTYLVPGVEPSDTIPNTLDVTEMEDEAVVLKVQRGVRSRLYEAGRFSPTMEKGVHHFQQLLCKHLK